MSQGCALGSRGQQMSWDILVLNFPPDIKLFEDLPEGFAFTALGKRADLIAKILEVAPSADFSDPSWGSLQGENWDIEINLGKEEETDSFMFHVRGGDGAVGAVGTILDHLGLRAYDIERQGFFVADADALKSFQTWRSYRDHVAERLNRGGPPS